MIKNYKKINIFYVLFFLILFTFFLLPLSASALVNRELQFNKFNTFDDLYSFANSKFVLRDTNGNVFNKGNFDNQWGQANEFAKSNIPTGYKYYVVIPHLNPIFNNNYRNYLFTSYGFNIFYFKEIDILQNIFQLEFLTTCPDTSCSSYTDYELYIKLLDTTIDYVGFSFKQQYTSYNYVRFSEIPNLLLASNWVAFSRQNVNIFPLTSTALQKRLPLTSQYASNNHFNLFSSDFLTRYNNLPTSFFKSFPFNNENYNLIQYNNNIDLSNSFSGIANYPTTSVLNNTGLNYIYFKNDPYYSFPPLEEDKLYNNDYFFNFDVSKPIIDYSSFDLEQTVILHDTDYFSKLKKPKAYVGEVEIMPILAQNVDIHTVGTYFYSFFYKNPFSASAFSIASIKINVVAPYEEINIKNKYGVLFVPKDFSSLEYFTEDGVDIYEFQFYFDNCYNFIYNRIDITNPSVIIESNNYFSSKVVNDDGVCPGFSFDSRKFTFGKLLADDRLGMLFINNNGNYDNKIDYNKLLFNAYVINKQEDLFYVNYISSNGTSSSLSLDDGLPINFVENAPLPESMINSPFSKPLFKESFGLNKVITLPLQLINRLTSTCSPLIIPIPFLNKTLILPCMSSYYQTYFGAFFIMYQSILSGFITYRVLVHYFKLIKSFRSPDTENVGVLDL